MRLNPHYPSTYLFALGQAYYLMRKNEEAIATLERLLSRTPDMPVAHRILAILYTELGREREARAEITELLRISPDFSLEVLQQRLPFKDPTEIERYVAALRKAGLK